MGRIAFVFSGQGAQAPGMGLEFYEKSEESRKVFETADIIRPGTSAQCFSGSEEELQQTVNTQPCLYAVEMAIAAAVTEAGFKAEAAAGFSLLSRFILLITIARVRPAFQVMPRRCWLLRMR